MSWRVRLRKHTDKPLYSRRCLNKRTRQVTPEFENSRPHRSKTLAAWKPRLAREVTQIRLRGMALNTNVRAEGPSADKEARTPGSHGRSVVVLYNCVRTHQSLNKEYASFSPGSADRCHEFTWYPWRTSSPIRSSLGFRYTQVIGKFGHPRNFNAVNDAVKNGDLRIWNVSPNARLSVRRLRSISRSARMSKSRVKDQYPWEP
jgi:hypothetical protein